MNCPLLYFNRTFDCMLFISKLYISGISCGVPPEGTNTVTVPQDNLLFEQMYNYSCLTGYETSDSLTTQCLSDGSWSLTTLPTCSSECHFCRFIFCFFSSLLCICMFSMFKQFCFSLTFQL